MEILNYLNKNKAILTDEGGLKGQHDVGMSPMRGGYRKSARNWGSNLGPAPLDYNCTMYTIRPYPLRTIL